MAPVVVALAVTVVSLWLVVTWQQRSDQTRVEQVMLAQIDALANHVSALEWRAIAGDEVSSEITDGVRTTNARIRSALAGIRRVDPADELTARRVPAAFEAYARAVAQELELLRVGDMRAARELDEATVDPAFEELSDSLAAADAEHAHDGDSARRRATVGSLITAGLAALLVGLLMWRFLRSRKRLIVLRAQEQGVRRSEREFRALAQNASDLVSVIDRDLTISYQSDSADHILGYPAAALVGRSLAELVHPDDLPRIMSLLPAGGEPLGDSHGRFEFRLRHRDGRWIETETLVTPLTNDLEDGNRLLLTGREIGERKALEEQLRHQAFHDALTGLPNRALFEDRVSHALASARRADAPLAVLFADLDDFKLVNDTFGHAAGDDLLRVVSQRLRGCLREADTAARLSGDEFAILLEDADQKTAQAMASRILDAVAAPVIVMNREILPRVSVGIAPSGAEAQQADVLMRNADVAMYEAKSRGGGSLALFDPSMHASAVRRFELIDDLHHALADGQFEVHYQPIVALETEEITGVEALLRWNHPRDGIISPLDFIPLAEQSGAIVPIGRWVLQEACRQAGIWDRDRGSDAALHVCVNLSTRQLADPDLVWDVRAALEAGRLRPEQLVLEITESLLIEDVEQTRKRLEELKAVGVRLAVDDFGTGYSALSYLHSFPLDILKIDKSFIDGLRHGTDQSNIVRALIELGESLHLDIVAEGIEEPSQLAELRSMHTDFGQGFLFARPLTARALTDLLEAGPLRPVEHALVGG